MSDSDIVKWIDSLPPTWGVVRLKFAAKTKNSNVDKKSYEDGIPVRLCNYTDVYYKEFISDDPQLMTATASRSEIERFALKSGDVIITKDSESWDDIAVPAYVPTDLPEVVCGYHLTLLRPYQQLYGRFLFRAFQASGVKEQFFVQATGITRYGLGQDGMRNAMIPIPPIDTQHYIAAFLDRKTAAIDALIEKKERLIALLEEKRAALINQAVTKGLDPNVPMKDSGIPWIGEIPEHWALSRVKFEFRNLNYKRIPLSAEERGKRQGEHPYYGASGVIDHVNDYLFTETTILIAEDGANLIFRNLPLAIIATGKYWVNNHAHIIQPHEGQVNYWASALESLDYRPFISGSAQPKLTAEAIGNVAIAVPPINERDAITKRLLEIDRKLSNPTDKLKVQLTKLKEYRQALITAAVTGKIDVTQEAV